MEAARLVSELPLKMEDLNIMEVDESIASGSESSKVESGSETSVRVLRRRKSTAPEPSKPSNRRVSMKPKRNVATTNTLNSKQIEALYLNKKIKSSTQTLETIYEEPKHSRTESGTYIGGRKIKRLLTFQIGSRYTKEKINKRRAKIKKFFGNKSFVNRKKIPMNMFLKTIECLDLDEVVESEGTVESVVE